MTRLVVGLFSFLLTSPIALAYPTTDEVIGWWERGAWEHP